MFGIPDPSSIAGAIVTGINQFIALRRLNEWTKLILTMTFSYCGSFSFVCGSALMARQNTAFAIGSGLIAGTVSATYLFRRSDLTKGLMVTLPSEEAQKEMDSNLQVIQRNK